MPTSFDKKDPVPRSALALVAAVALAASLAGCSASASAPSSASPTTSSSTTAAPTTDAACQLTAPGAASDGISVTGDFDSKPTVTFTSPLSVDATQRTVAIQGTGDQVTSGARANVEYTLIDAANGKELAASSYDGSDYLTLTIGSSLVGLEKMMSCSTVGSRVVAVIPPADAWGEAGQSSLGVAGTDTIVFVADITGIIPPIVAEDFATMKDMPTVAFDANGAPTITIPDIDPPQFSRLGVISEGTGDVVPAGSSVTVNYTGVNWRTGKVFDSSWESGTPATFTTSQVVNGFRAAIEGQKVGSEVIVVAAPIDGYGSTGSGEDIAPGDTIVFVIDIISIN